MMHKESKIMQIVKDKISLEELKKMAERSFSGFVKAVVDIEKEIMAVDAGMHADEEKLLLENGSKQQDLWGINIYPDIEGDNRIEFDSMINLRPWQGNRTRGIEDKETQEKIIEIVNKLIC